MQTTEPHTTEGPSLVDKARELHDFIAAHREESEKNRRVSDEVMDAIKEAGLIRGLQSIHYGGLEVEPAEWYRAMIEVSSADPSAGWLVGILGVHPFEFAQMSIEMQDELYRDNPDTLISSSYAPQSQIRRVPGGFRITGQHRTSSGVDHASWVVIGGVIPDEDGATGRRTFVIPMKDVRIVDDWYVLGLSGTGSKSIAFDDVFVPEHRSAARQDLMNATGPGMAINDRPLYRIPHGAVYGSAGAGPAVGVAKAAYSEYLAQISTYITRRTGQNKAEDPFTHLRIGDAQALIEAAELRTVWAYEDMYAKAAAGEPITLQDRAHYSWRMAQAADDCVTAVRTLFESRGASAVFLSNPLQAYYRDIITMRQHGTQDRDARASTLAKAELGLPLEELFI
jgi:3-hydroxy-9,10-secoandrosta-1,3,5(10)-triene-9,17-dione monooxygenase